MRAKRAGAAAGRRGRAPRPPWLSAGAGAACREMWRRSTAGWRAGGSPGGEALGLSAVEQGGTLPLQRDAAASKLIDHGMGAARTGAKGGGVLSPLSSRHFASGAAAPGAVRRSRCSLHYGHAARPAPAACRGPAAAMLRPAAPGPPGRPRGLPAAQQQRGTPERPADRPCRTSSCWAGGGGLDNGGARGGCGVRARPPGLRQPTQQQQPEQPVAPATRGGGRRRRWAGCKGGAGWQPGAASRPCSRAPR